MTSCSEGFQHLFKAQQATPLDNAEKSLAYGQMMEAFSQQLTTGDIVTRLGNDFISDALRKINTCDPSFSHCGFVKIENGYPFVYHAIGGEDNPDNELQRDSLHVFWSPKSNLAIGAFHTLLDTSQRVILSAYIDSCYAVKPKFDMAFDIYNNVRLYCSEFVVNGINRSHPLSENIQPQKIEDKYLYTVDAAFCNKYVREIGRYTLK
jgi:hypothetical protein